MGYVCNPLLFVLQNFKESWTTQIAGKKQQVDTSKASLENQLFLFPALRSAATFFSISGTRFCSITTEQKFNISLNLSTPKRII